MQTPCEFLSISVPILTAIYQGERLFRVHPSPHSKRLFTEEEDGPELTPHMRSAKKQKVEVTEAVRSAIQEYAAALIMIGRALQMIGDGYMMAVIAWERNARRLGTLRSR
jgi:hypothetical protein